MDLQHMWIIVDYIILLGELQICEDVDVPACMGAVIYHKEGWRRIHVFWRLREMNIAQYSLGQT